MSLFSHRSWATFIAITTVLAAIPTAAFDGTTPVLSADGIQPIDIAHQVHLNNTGVGAVKSSTTAFPMVKGATAAFKLFTRNATAGQRDVGDVLEITMTTPIKGRYVSIGPSVRQMTGSLLVCFVAVDTTGAGECEVWAGNKLDMARMQNPPLVHVQSARTLGTGYEVVARIAASDFGVDVNGKRQRVITALGPYVAATRTAEEHDSGEYSHLEVNFLTGEVTLPKTSVFMWIAIGVDILIAFVYCLVATLIHRCTRLMLRPTASTVMIIVTMSVLVAMCAIVGVGRGLDAAADLRTAPWARGVGAAAIAGAVITLFPTPKFLNPGWLFGATYERLIPFHRVTAIAMTIASTIHGVWFMVDFLPSGSELFSASGYSNSPLTGFISWFCFTIVTVSSLFGLPRRHMFWLWRLVHCLFIPGYFAAIIHYPAILLGLAVPLILYICDLVARILATALTGAKVKSVQVFEEAEIVALDVELTGSCAPAELSPGDFVHIGFMTKCCNWATHPITIAFYDAETKVATFYIKALSATGWSGKLLEYAKATPEQLVGTRVIWVGPFGALQVPIGRVSNTVLVSGGIGVTPMLSVLQYLSSDTASNGTGTACRGPEVGGGGGSVDRCVFVWAARGPAIINALRPQIEDAAKKAGAEVLIFDTTKTLSIADRGAADSASVMMQPIHDDVALSGRPDISRLLADRFADDVPVAVYVCGPEPMMDSCYDAASARPLTYLHRETFEM